MRRMGIDYGTKRIGVALTDESGTMAFPHSVVPNDDDALDTIAGVATDAKAVEIVVGASVNLKGEDNRLQKDIVQFSETLTAKTDIAVAMQPEQYTTQEALQIQGRNAMTDASAATIILNSYITTKQSQNNS